MNRGYEGRSIFKNHIDKSIFLKLLGKVQQLTKIRILAYCVLDNHYHLVVQNSSGKMSEFFKQLNGQYAVYFRKRYGGKGYVFQDRYRSMLIQDDAYLKVSIAYVLGNPIKAHLADAFDSYAWSSGSLYFKPEAKRAGVDRVFVEELFATRKDLKLLVNSIPLDELPTVHSELGIIIGGEEFIDQAAKLAERRSGRESLERRRSPDKYFESIEKIYMEFERKHKIKLEDLEVNTHAGKRLRAELLVHLKERVGLTYREIAKMDIFGDLSMSSLGTIYQRKKKRAFGKQQ